MFDINQLNDTHAVLLTNASGIFNRFKIPVYNITVLVEDVGGLSCTIDVEVRVAEGSRFYFQALYRPGYLTGFVQKEVRDNSVTYRQPVEFFEELYFNDIDGILAPYRFITDPPLAGIALLCRAPTPATSINAVLHQTTIYFDRPLVTAVAQLHSSAYKTFVQPTNVTLVVSPLGSSGIIPVIGEPCDIESHSGLCSLTARIPKEWYVEAGGVREANVHISSMNLNDFILPSISIIPVLDQPQSELRDIVVRVPFYPVTNGETFVVRVMGYTPDPVVAFQMTFNTSSDITITGLVDDEQWTCNQNNEVTYLNLLCIYKSGYTNREESDDDNILGVQMMVNNDALPQTATVSSEIVAVTGIKGRLIDLPQPAVHLSGNGTSDAEATIEVIYNEPQQLFAYSTTLSEVINPSTLRNDSEQDGAIVYVVRRSPIPAYSEVSCEDIELSYDSNALDIDSTSCTITVGISNTEQADPAIVNISALGLATELPVRVWFPNRTLQFYLSDHVLNYIECTGTYQTAWIDVFATFHTGDLVSPQVRISEKFYDISQDVKFYDTLRSSNDSIVSLDRLNVIGLSPGTVNITVDAEGFHGYVTVTVTDDPVHVFNVLPQVSTGLTVTASPDTYGDTNSSLYVIAEVTTSFASIPSTGYLTAVIYFTDGARMDVSDSLVVQSISGAAVINRTGGEIVSQYPGISTLDVAWICTAPTVDSGNGYVDILVEVPQPVGLIVNLIHNRLAHSDAGLMAVGIPDRTTVTVWLDFGDGALVDVTDESVFDGPHTANIWTPFDITTQYNGTATLEVAYNYFGQNYTGQESISVVEINSVSLSVVPYGSPEVSLNTIRYISDLTDPVYQLASVILSATLSDGSAVQIPEFGLSVDADNCSSKPYAFTPCPSSITDENVTVTINASFTSFTDSVIIMVNTLDDPVKITNINVMVSDGDDVTQKTASISLQLSDNTVIPNVYDYFSNSPSDFLSYSTDPIEDSVFSFDLDTGAITIHKDHYKMAELIISLVNNPNNISGSGLFIANVDDGESILVGSATGIPIPPVSISDTFTVPIFYNVSINATSYIARFQFSEMVLRAVSVSVPFHRPILTNLNAPPGQVTITGLLLGDEHYNVQNGLKFDVVFEALNVGVSPIEAAIELLYDGYSYSSTNFGSGAVIIGASENYYDVMNSMVSVGQLLFALQNEFIILSRDLVHVTVENDLNNDTITSVDDVVFGIKLVTGLAFYLRNIVATPVQDSDNCTLLVGVSYSGIGDIPPDPRSIYSFVFLTNPDVELLSISKPRFGGYVSQLDMAVLYEADPNEDGYTLELVTPITVLNNIGISVIQLVGDYSNRTDYDHLNIFALTKNIEQSVLVDVTSQRSPLISLEDVRIGTMATGFEPLTFINNTHRSDYCYFDNDGVYIVQPPENTTVNTIIYNVLAVEPGFPTNSEVYDLVATNASSTFMFVDRVTGGLRLIQPLDFEEIGFYFFTFTATYTLSNGSTVTIGPADIIIQVADINDNTPQIDATTINQTMTFDEDVAVNTNVITIIATDRDFNENGRITYSIVSGDELGQFFIDPDNGNITITRPLDREYIASYDLQIQVSDNGVEPRTSITYVFITLNDINDNPPFFDREVYNVSINENSPNGTRVPGLLLVADDPDIGGTFTYSLINDTDFPFDFNRDSEFTLIDDVLDTELQDVYTAIAVVTDDENVSLTSTALIVINIGDVNDNAPVFIEALENQYYVEIDSPLSEVGFVFATDADRTTNKQIAYDLISDVTMFGIDPDTGVISAVEPYDGTSNRLQTLTIIARDMGTPQLNDTTLVYIILIESQVVSFLPSNGLSLLGYPSWVEDIVYDQQLGVPFAVDIGDTTMVTAQFGASVAEGFSDVFIPIVGDPAINIEMLVLQEIIHYDLRTITVLIQAEDARNTIPLPSLIMVTITPSEELRLIQNIIKTGSCMTTENQGFCVVQLVDFPLEWFNKEPDNVGDHVTVSASLLNDIGNVVVTKEATIGVETHPIYNVAAVDSNARMLLIGPTHLSISSEIYTMEIYIRVTNGAPEQTNINGDMVLQRVSIIRTNTITENGVTVINNGTAGVNWECCKDTHSVLNTCILSLFVL